MKSLVALLIVLTCCAGAANAQIRLEIGAKLHRKYIPKQASYIATHPSQFRPFIKRKLNNVEYLIAYDEDTRRIKYIHTTDRNFRTTGGLRIGSQMPLTREQLLALPSWEIRAPITADGWYPIVGVDLPGDFDLVGSFKGNETKMVTIVGFSKGGN